MRSIDSRFVASILALAPALCIACAEDHAYTPASDPTTTTGAVTASPSPGSSHGSEYRQTQSQSNVPGTLSDAPGSSHGSAYGQTQSQSNAPGAPSDSSGSSHGGSIPGSTTGDAGANTSR
jgi:hypothetical protein